MSKMDIGAYKNIDDLEFLLKENNIEIPRLRGLRVMANEKKVSSKELVTMLHEHLLEVADGVLTSDEDFLDYTSILVFFKRHQGIRKYIVCDGKRLPGSIVVTELQAINQMCRELGWLNGK